MCNCVTCQCIEKQVQAQRNQVTVEVVDKPFMKASELRALAEKWYATGHYMAVSCATELCKYIESHT